MPSVRKVDKIKSFNIPPTISRVSLIGRRFLALRRQRSLIFSNKGGLPVCGPLFVIKAVVKRHRPCIMQIVSWPLKLAGLESLFFTVEDRISAGKHKRLVSKVSYLFVKY